jgi:hypothetical protein
MKSKIMDRPMFKKPVDETDVENVGIMQGFMDEMEAEDEMEDDEDYQTEKMLDRRPNSPEILMNNLRGDMRSIDARVEELADMVGYNAAADTPQDVLALLQPVFAQQQAAPAMPPQGAMPPAMPQGAPAMPPQPAPMPPEAAMGGIGALSMDQGPGMEQPPVAMARGGYVQRFSEGSDEDGVTPTEDTSSYAGVFSDDVVQDAQDRVLSLMRQKPLAVPDLSEEVDKRIPLYEKLLGVDKNQSQAQILFELGQRAFNYGANVDDQGRALTGSQASRLAGAARTLPTSMGAISSQLDKENRAVRSAALQSAEKDVQLVRSENFKLVDSQRKLAGSIAKGKKTEDKGYGTSERGVAQTVLYKFAPGYGAGTLSDEMDRKFESAIKILTTPTQYTDPYNGNIVKTVPELPNYAITAIKTRKGLAELSSKVSPPSDGIYTGTELSAEDLDLLKNAAERNVPGAVDALSAYNQSRSPQAIPSTSGAVLPTTPAGSATPATTPTRTLFSLSKDLTGPVAAGKAGVAKVPGLGGAFPEVTQARAYAETAINGIVSALRTTDRFGNSERQEIKQDLGLDPKLFDNPTALRNRLIGIGEFIDQEKEMAEGQLQNEDLPVELRKSITTRLEEMKNATKLLGLPPKVYTLEEVAALGPNAEFLWNGTTLRRTK